MQDTDSSTSEPSEHPGISPWRLIGWVCAGVIAASVIACVVMAAMRSTGLTQITITALDQKFEPRDHLLPLVKQKEALPDYEITVLLTNGNNLRLGAKPDVSAVDGLTWHLAEPVSVDDVASIRLLEQDKVIADSIAEVQFLGNSVTEGNYRFDFTTERLASVGISSFFKTPIGKAIAAGFFIAVLLMLLSAFSAW